MPGGDADSGYADTGYADAVCDMCDGAMVEEEGFPLGDDLLCESCYAELEPADSEDEPEFVDDEEFGDEYARAGIDDDDGFDDDDDEPW